MGTAFTIHHQRFCVSVSLFAPLWYRTAVSGAWFLSGGCHRLVMVGSWCTVLATHVYSCSFVLSLSRCSVVGSQVLPRCALPHISCCLAPFDLMPKSLLQTHCIIGVNVSKNQFLTPCFSPLNADGLCACGLLRAVLLMDDHDTLSQCLLPARAEYVTVRARCGGWWWLWRMMIPNEMLCLASLTTMPPAVCASLNFSSTWCLLNPAS